MVDRVEQKDINPYRVREAEESTKDSDEDKGQESYPNDSFFSEKTDWRLLYEKNPHVAKAKTLMTQDIRHFLFQSVSLKNNPSILEAIVIHSNNQAEGPVFIPLPRERAWKLQHHRKGDLLAKELLCSGHYLQVILPEPLRPPTRLQNTEDTLREAVHHGKQIWKSIGKTLRTWSWEWVLLYSVITLLIGWFIFLALYL